MNAATYYTLILVIAIGTYATRFPPLLLGRVLRLSPRLKRGFEYVPMGVFGAMAVPDLILHTKSGGGVDWPFDIGALCAILVAGKTKSPLWTMVVGVVVVACLRLFL